MRRKSILTRRSSQIWRWHSFVVSLIRVACRYEDGQFTTTVRVNCVSGLRKSFQKLWEVLSRNIVGILCGAAFNWIVETEQKGDMSVNDTESSNVIEDFRNWRERRVSFVNSGTVAATGSAAVRKQKVGRNLKKRKVINIWKRESSRQRSS
jgi:hypothetical protein